MKYWANGENNTGNLLNCTGGNSDFDVSGHSHPAAIAASSFSEDLPPNATSGWFLPSANDWAKAMMGAGGAHIHFSPASITYRQGYTNSILDNFNASLNRGNSELSGGSYWLSNEHNLGHAGYADEGTCLMWVSSNGTQGTYFRMKSDDKTRVRMVRPFFRFKFASHISLTNNYSLQLYGEHREDLDDI